MIREKLDDLDKMGVNYHPSRKDMFKALAMLPSKNVKVVIIGQDPYPKAIHATGLAFSVPKFIKDYPPTLKIIFDELVRDLDVPYPPTGNLEDWVEEGVLLWNAIPVCLTTKSLSLNWEEWKYCTQGILDKLVDQCVVVAALGTVAKSHLRPEDYENFKVIEVGHPSPRGNLNSKKPFTGSRLFSTINQKLVESGLTPIDWRL